MPIITCPHCDMRITVGFDCVDFVHDCSQSNKSNAIKNEDVVVTGDWEDFSGKETKSAQEVMRQGLVNELQGTDAGLKGKQKEAVTRRGARASTHRQRNHLEFINIKNVKKS